MAIGTNFFDPRQVSLGPSGRTPYLKNPDIGRFGGGNPTIAGSTNVGGTAQVPRTDPPTGTIGSESVRATGSGPFDSAYRQNLATYSGGQFMRPGGNLSFNPTDISTFPGAPTGAGSAPLPGLPDSLIQTALGGNPFSFTPPQPQAPATDNNSIGQPDIPDWQFWLRQIRNQGGGYMPFMQ